MRRLACAALFVVAISAFVRPAAAGFIATSEDVAEIVVERWLDGYTQRDVAFFLGLSASTVSRIISRYVNGEPLVKPRGAGSRGQCATRQVLRRAQGVARGPARQRL